MIGKVTNLHVMHICMHKYVHCIDFGWNQFAELKCDHIAINNKMNVNATLIIEVCGKTNNISIACNEQAYILQLLPSGMQCIYMPKKILLFYKAEFGWCI